MDILPASALTETQLLQAAQILSASLPLGWPTLQAAWEELEELLASGGCLLAALEDGVVTGLGGLLPPDYDGRVWELHPLAVEASRRGRGIGRALVTALEDTARARGDLLMWLGADDEQGETSLSHTDLFDNLPRRLASFDPGRHASAFYMKLGYQVIGVVPDANGPGKPDILLGKRL